MTNRTNRKNKKIKQDEKSSYGFSIVNDIDGDNSFEENMILYSDSVITEALNYIMTMTFTNIEINDINNLHSILHELEIFLMQYIVEGFAAFIDGKTLINSRIQEKLYINGKWHIVYKSKEIENLSQPLGKDIIILITDKKHRKDIEHDKYISNDFLIVRKNFINRSAKILDLINRKSNVDNILELAIQKNVIPLLIAKAENLTPDNEQKLKDILTKYKNASVLVLNNQLVPDIEQLKHDVNTELIFNYRAILNTEIASLIGFSNSIFIQPRSFSYTNGDAVANIINRNVNKYRLLMEGVINEYFEKYNIDDKIKLPPLSIDEYDVENITNGDNND